MRRRGVDEAWDALEEMQRTGLPTNRFTVSRMLMKTLADARKYWDPAKIQRSVALVERFLQLQPEEADEILFNALLDTHCRMKDSSGLETTLSRMHELNIEPSHVTLGILVKAYGQACDIKSVLRLWDEMVEQRRQANAVTYGCMINACVRCGQTAKAVEIFNEMKVLRKHCNTILYTTLIKGYGNEKDINSALALFREMKEEGVPYNTIAYNSIIDVCIKCSDLQVAEDIFREMLAPQSNVQPDLITYSTLLKGYCHVGNLDKALQVAETIKACGLKCDELVYNTLMDGCVKANDLSAGVGLFAEMMQSGMKPSSITHSIFMRLYQRNGYKGNASEAVAQLYQHHGLERPTSLEKPSRSRGKGNKSQRGSNNGGGLESAWQPGMPMQQLPPGAMPSHMLTGTETQRNAGPPQVAPGCWNPTPASSLLNGLGTIVGSQMPMATQQLSMMTRTQVDPTLGILSNPSAYQGISAGRAPAMYAPPQHVHMAGTMPFEGNAVAMNLVPTAVPWLQACHAPMNTIPAPQMRDVLVPSWDNAEMQFPSLLLQQRQRDECLGEFGPDLRKPLAVEA
jgi:pentatricopeptide repeat protein